MEGHHCSCCTGNRSKEGKEAGSRKDGPEATADLGGDDSHRARVAAVGVWKVVGVRDCVILKVMQTGFANELDVGDRKVFGCNMKDGTEL